MKTKTFWWFMLGSFSVCLLHALPLLMRADSPEEHGRAFGSMIGFAVIPFLIAAIARGRKGDWDSFSKWFFFGLLVVSFLTLQQELKDWRNSSTDQMSEHMGEIIRNAQAGHPDAAVANSTPYDDALRGVYADAAVEAKAHKTAVANIDLGNIYAPASYASKSSIQQSLSRVQVLAAADQRIYNFWLSAPQVFEKRIKQSSASESGKKGAMVGFQEQFDKSPLTPYYKAECAWSKSLVDLFSFALEHSSEIHLSGQGLLSNPGVLDEFKQKQEASLKQREAVMTLASPVRKRTQDLGKEFGLKGQ